MAAAARRDYAAAVASMSRGETQQRNRERVLGAARELFLRDGYAATSLVAVARHAGFSTGAVYSNFPGKLGLALEVLREIEAERVAELAADLLAAEPTADKLTVVRAWVEAALASGWPRLELDVALTHRDDPDLVRLEHERHDALVRRIGVEVRPFLPERLRTPTVEHAVADAVMNLTIGSAVRRIFDPEADVSELLDTLHALVSGRLP